MGETPSPREAADRWTSRDVAHVLFRRGRSVAAFLVASAAGAAAYCLLAPAVYRSEAKLLVRIGRESVALDPTATTGQTIGVALSRMNEINSELEILTSRGIAERTVDAVGAGRLLPGAAGATVSRRDRAKAVDLVLESLDVSVVKDSNVIAASFEARDPTLARAVLEQMMAAFLDRHIAAHRTSGSHSFFALETEKLRARLDRIETALRDLMNESGIVSLEEQRQILSQNVGEFERELSRTNASRAAARARLDALITQVEGLPPMLVSSETSGIPGTAVETMRERLYELQMEEQDLRARYRPDSVPVARVRRQIEDAKLLLSREAATHREVTTELNGTRRELDLALHVERVNVASLDASRRAQQQDLALARERLSALNGVALRVERLARERALEEAKFRECSGRLEQARVDQALEEQRISNIGVVQPATLPMKPVRPRKRLVLALGILFGLAGGAGIAFLSEQLDRTFHTPRDVERRTGLPALGSIPLGRAEPSGGAHAIREFEGLRERLLLASRGDGASARTVGVLGSTPGEGASTVAAGLAIRLARGGDGPVLLADASLHGPAVHRAFGLGLSPGLAEVLSGAASAEAATAPSGIDDLDLLPAGDAGIGVPFARHTRDIARLAGLWKERYRFVIVDLPSVAQAPAVVRAAAPLDGVLLVIEAGRSRFEAFARTRDFLGRSGGRVIGVVLNKRRFPVPQWVYDRL